MELETCPERAWSQCCDTHSEEKKAVPRTGGDWERLEFLDLQSLQRRRERYVLIHMFKIWKGLAPNGPGFDFRDTPRSGPRAVIPKFNHRAQRSASTMFENSFSVHGAKLWNTLPKGAKEAGSVDELKVVLGEHLRGIADRPPTRGYSCITGNSLLDFALSRGTDF